MQRTIYDNHISAVSGSKSVCTTYYSSITVMTPACGTCSSVIAGFNTCYDADVAILLIALWYRMHWTQFGSFMSRSMCRFEQLLLSMHLRMLSKWPRQEGMAASSALMFLLHKLS